MITRYSILYAMFIILIWQQKQLRMLEILVLCGFGRKPNYWTKKKFDLMTVIEERSQNNMKSLGFIL